MKDLNQVLRGAFDDHRNCRNRDHERYLLGCLRYCDENPPHDHIRKYFDIICYGREEFIFHRTHLS